MIALGRRRDITLKFYETVAWQADGICLAPEALALLALIRRDAPPITALRALGPDLGRLSEAITLEIFGRSA